MNKTVRNILVITTLMINIAAHAAKPIYSGGRDRAAIRGYDAVAYFTENSPVKGVDEHTFEYEGAKWMFASAQNKALFEANPKQYAPQFGGYCAYAVAKGTTASIKPQFFTIHNDKLYLNYSKSVFKRWTADKKDLISDAESNWPTVLE